MKWPPRGGASLQRSSAVALPAAPDGPGPGDVAPPFTLRHRFGTDVSLADVVAEGPVLLAFYVFDFGFV